MIRRGFLPKARVHDPLLGQRRLAAEVWADPESVTQLRRDRSLTREGLAVFGALLVLSLALGVAARLLLG